MVLPLFTKAVVNFIVDGCEGSKKGARNLRNLIRKEIEDKIINIMIEGDGKPLKKVTVDYKKNIVILTE
jgi:ATP-dependent Clp protease ATP-binding subunit ClpA